MDSVCLSFTQETVTFLRTVVSKVIFDSAGYRLRLLANYSVYNYRSSLFYVRELLLVSLFSCLPTNTDYLSFNSMLPAQGCSDASRLFVYTRSSEKKAADGIPSLVSAALYRIPCCKHSSSFTPPQVHQLPFPLPKSVDALLSYPLLTCFLLNSLISLYLTQAHPPSTRPRLTHFLHFRSSSLNTRPPKLKINISISLHHQPSNPIPSPGPSPPSLSSKTIKPSALHAGFPLPFSPPHIPRKHPR